ncbi:methyltransferase domain-containing protein [Bacillus aquiflavi]|uniref:Methyltransferase domain-containing protein n=1 Tax=Bacillus aquiflavi TaxID=2672567 RepID=A0A6B3VYC5_9BACI|nr:methyltransferase domain-containing protein [Bacillus aquiflavi]MBA4536163.1 methyltransferase domain-containing protein [Bacillus aquiflavi]NEY80536.1 methyltransferase domain-containing protein [Bacillus aquiflavi]UAC47000.1 methyltransferase domain-containing protein [Bacillus aquiflavi]
MTKKIKSIEVFREFVEAFRCPHCKGPFQVVDLKSLKCTKNHTFDFAKQGYVNLTTHSSKSLYDKKLFEARQRIIMESNLFALLHKKISKMINDHLDDFPRFPFLILDAGCGEGSHLHKVLDDCRNTAITGVGLDISKAGIVMAAKNYKEPIWLVGDLAKSPLKDQSFHVILNILSPSNYKEFKRILVPNGLVIKVVPRPNYLKELRETLFENTKKVIYKSSDTAELFKKHFKLKAVYNLCYTKKLNQAEQINLVQMSPLSWNSERTDIDSFINRASSEVTVDLDILIGLNVQ